MNGEENEGEAVSEPAGDPVLSSNRSERFGYAAFALWFVSLALPGLTAYGNSDDGFGLVYLVLGWATGAFAWLANIFIVIGAFTLARRTRVPIFSALLAPLCAADALRYTQIPDIDGGPALFGYGWGFIAWFLAALMVLLGTCVRSIDVEPERSSERRFAAFCTALTMLATAVLVVGVGVLAVTQRMHASGVERNELAHAVIKRGVVCERESYQPDPSPLLVARVVQLSTASADFPWSAPYGYPFHEFRNLEAFRLGAPFVRFGDYDFYLAGPPGERELQARLARSVPDVTLTDRVDEQGQTIELRLPGSAQPLRSWSWTRRTVPCPALEARPIALIAAAIAADGRPLQFQDSLSQLHLIDGRHRRSKQLSRRLFEDAPMQPSAVTVSPEPDLASAGCGPQRGSINVRAPELIGNHTWAIARDGLIRFRPSLWPMAAGGLEALLCSGDQVIVGELDSREDSVSLFVGGIGFDDLEVRFAGRIALPAGRKKIRRLVGAQLGDDTLSVYAERDIVTWLRLDVPLRALALREENE